MYELIFIGLIVQIFLQAGCAVIAIGCFNRLNSNYGSVFLCGAFALMAIRRMTALASFDWQGSGVSMLDKLVLPLSISILMFIGLYVLRQRIELEAEKRERRLQEVLKELNKKIVIN